MSESLLGASGGNTIDEAALLSSEAFVSPGTSVIEKAPIESGINLLFFKRLFRLIGLGNFLRAPGPRRAIFYF